MGECAAPGLRLAEVLGALSLAGDLSNAQRVDHGLRTALLATRLAADQPNALRSEVFWTGVLRYLGCSGFAVEEASYAAGDDIGLRAGFMRIDLGKPAQFVGAVLRDVGRGAPLVQRVRGVGQLLSSPGAPRAHAHAQCDVAVHCSRKLAMPPGVVQALRETEERYDGRGLPDGIGGEQLTLAQRCVEVARVAALCHAHGGLAGGAGRVAPPCRRSPRSAAGAALRRRRRGAVRRFRAGVGVGRVPRRRTRGVAARRGRTDAAVRSLRADRRPEVRPTCPAIRAASRCACRRRRVCWGWTRPRHGAWATPHCCTTSAGSRCRPASGTSRAR